MFPCYSHLSHLDQTYLSEYEGDGAYGHIALGRSFALEMAVAIPSSHQRLGKRIVLGIPYMETKSLSKGSVDSYGVDMVNVASDFIAQYTMRQVYRYSEIPSVQDSIVFNAHGQWNLWI